MDDKIIVIAGGSSGMGLALAKKLRGSRLHLVGGHSEKSYGQRRKSSVVT